MPAERPLPVLILAPSGRDAELMAGVLEKAGIAAAPLAALEQLNQQLLLRSGILVIGEESLGSQAVEYLSGVLHTQPSWSDLPIIVLTGGGGASRESSQLAAVREPLGNITLLERPLRSVTLISAVRAALRSRLRQYEIREHLHERQRSEEELRQSNAQFRQLADSMPQLVWTAGPDGLVTWCNQRWYEYTGQTPGEVASPPWSVMKDETRRPALMQSWGESLRTGRQFEMELPLTRSDGSVRWFLTRVSAVLGPGGEIVRWLATSTDVHEQREIRETLQQIRQDLEQRVEQRTAELARANASLRDLSARLLQLQDEERRRIARELHDSVGQLMAAVSMNLALALEESHRLSPAAGAALAENETLVQSAIGEIRTISYLLHPPLLDETGLAAALQWYVEGFIRRSRIRVGLTLSPDIGRLPRELETAVFRVVQEALTNIHRHSGSLEAEIEIDNSPDEITVQVRDYGKGIPSQTMKKLLSSSGTPGVGVRGMRERVQQLGGIFEITSKPGLTALNIRLPVSATKPSQPALA